MSARLLIALLLPAVLAKGAGVEFNRDIRPVLSENCFRCHGPDPAARKGKLRLDLRDDALAPRKNGAAIVPGKPAESGVIKRLLTTDPDDVMPPPDTHKQVTPAQRELIRRWIFEGAKYEAHWAYLPPTRRSLPEEIPASKHTAQSSNSANPIDIFISTKLREKQLSLSAEADRRTLLRRLSLDVTGLPPTPEEIASFLRDRSDKAYERQVDRLLNSLHYGERMAVPWLDVVRYADTVGYHGDQNIHVFPYRDYVINAFNSNKPFDQFTIEQLAGDLLPNPTTEQRVATGFNRLNMVTREGGAQPGEYLAKYGGDRVRTVAMTWLGSTMGCCECHDHKFDPFATRDFYSMKAFFADIQQWGVYQDYDYTPNPDLRGWSNDHPFPPEMLVDSDYLRRRHAELSVQLTELTIEATKRLRKDPAQTATFKNWLEEGRTYLKQHRDVWNVLTNLTVTKVGGTNVTPASHAVIGGDGVVSYRGKDPTDDRIELVLPGGWFAALRIELLPDADHEGRILRGRGNSGTVQLAAELRSANRTPLPLTFWDADANYHEARYANGQETIGVQGGWKTSAAQVTNRHVGIWLLNRPMQVTAGDVLVLNLKGNPAARLRIALSPFVMPPRITAAPWESAWNEQINFAFRRDILLGGPRADYLYHWSTVWNPELTDQMRQQARRQWECQNGKAWTVITQATNAPATRVLARGNWQDESGEIVSPNPPAFLPRAGLPEDRRLNRLDLAHWLVAPENPLTSRVFVNRLWKQFFGTGLSAVVDDLGAQGESPSHPELLDWLAVDFRESGWDIKRMARLVVTSQTYRQSSNLRLDLHEIDPNNRLLATQNPRRLEAEFVRDNALAIAGLLNSDLGGPSAFPYQPPGYYLNIQFPDRDYYASRGGEQYRRGLYAHWQRTFLQPMLANFDAPAREECTATRNVSNTPQQALTLLNDPTFVEASRLFAQRLLAPRKQTDDQRIEAAFHRAVARPAKPAEIQSLKNFLAEQRATFRTNTDDAAKSLKSGFSPTATGIDPVELAAWTQVARVVLNLHETITRY